MNRVVHATLVGLVAFGGSAACRSGSAPSTVVVVDAFGGTTPEPGALVVSHSPGGDVVDVTEADAAGRAQVGIDEDSLVSVVFPGVVTSITAHLTVVTTLPPGDGTELEIHGPKSTSSPPLIVGVLQLDGPNLNTATYFDVTLGCVTVNVPSLPVSIDVSACNMGTDQNLDILVRGYHPAGEDLPPHLDGYAAGRVAMTDGVATFRVPAWETTGTAVPLTLDAVQPFVSWTMYADTLPFIDELLDAAPHLYTGLMVDSTTVTATLPAAHGAQITMRETTGTPAAIHLGSSDFLGSLDAVPVISSTTPTTITWDAADLGADAINLHATWDVGSAVSGAVPPGPHRVIWEAILPTGATRVTLPTLSADLGRAIAPGSILPTDVVLRHIDISDLEGFEALRAAGIHAEQTISVNPIVARPTMGQVRVAQTIGGQ